MDLGGPLHAALAPRFTLLRVLGRGGMATVYLASDTESGDEVALKVLDPEVTSALHPARFSREIRIAAGLEHPNVLPLLESGDAEGSLFFTMPFVRGESLEERLIRQGQLGVREAVRIARAVAAALDYAHSVGVVHRDVKPANILLADDGEIFLADFGIARMVTEANEDRLTATGHRVGTPAYSSPEQTEAGSQVDGRTDVYSLGCVIHEMLAGQPPFTGKTAQSVTAQHLGAPPPSLEAIRPGLPGALVAAVQRSLAKVPADRFGSAGDLIEAITAASAPTPTAVRRRRYALASLGGVILAGALVLTVRERAPPLDPNKVVVFPLATTSAIQDPSAGWDVALAVGAALEHTEPLRFIDGWTWLSQELRSNPEGVTADIARSLARSRGAAFYMTGAIRAEGDAASVVIGLYDAAGDSVVAQETAEGPIETGSLAALGLEGALGVLPRLVDPDRPVDLTSLTDRAPAATALFLQGERAYRQSHFAEAVEFYERSVAEDSLHAFAAIKGAQAADWAIRFDAAERLVETALANGSLLPEKYRAFAAGLDAYLDGRAEAARMHLSGALGLDPEWPEAALAMAEVYYHLLPLDAHAPDSLAAYWLRTALASDSTFGPPLFHLAEITLRRGGLDESEALVRRWAGFTPDSVLFRQLELSVDCLRAGAEAFDWGSYLADYARPVLQAGTALAGAAGTPACARGALEAVFESDLPANTWRGRALLGLFGLELAAGRYDEARHLLDRALDAGISYAHMYFTYGAVAGAPFDSEAARAEGMLTESFGSDYEGLPAEFSWLMGIWLLDQGRADRARALASALEVRAEAAESPIDTRLALGLRARLLAADGAVDDAVAILEDLSPDAERNAFITSLSNPLGPERLLLAELQLSQGRFSAAHGTAALLDHAAPLAYLPLLPRSLAVRIRAAQGMRRPDLVEAARARLNALGWSEAELVSPVTSSKEGVT